MIFRFLSDFRRIFELFLYYSVRVGANLCIRKDVDVIINIAWRIAKVNIDELG